MAETKVLFSVFSVGENKLGDILSLNKFDLDNGNQVKFVQDH